MTKFIKYIGALFMEKKDGQWAISIGRVGWWIAFLPAVYIWIFTAGTQDITDHHSTILLILATYNLGKHGLNFFKKKEEINNGTG